MRRRYLTLTCSLLLLQGCTVQLWKSLDRGPRVVDRSIQQTYSDVEVRTHLGSETAEFVVLPAGDGCDELPPSWRGRPLALSTGLDSALLALLEDTPSGWTLRSLRFRLVSEWQGMSAISQTTAIASLHGVLEASCYARVLAPEDVPAWVENGGECLVDAFDGGGSRDPRIRAALRRFAHWVELPELAGKLAPRLEPVAWMGAEGQRCSEAEVSAAVARGMGGATNFALLGRYDDEGRTRYVHAPLPILWFGARFYRTENPELWRWELARECFVSRTPGELYGSEPPAHLHCELLWKHERSELAAYGFWDVAWRVAVTPVAVVLDLTLIGLLTELFGSDDANEIMWGEESEK